MKKLLILLAFAGVGVFSTACGESCYECVNNQGAVTNSACAVDDATANDEMAAIETQENTDGDDEDVSCSLN